MKLKELRIHESWDKQLKGSIHVQDEQINLDLQIELTPEQIDSFFSQAFDIAKAEVKDRLNLASVRPLERPLALASDGEPEEDEEDVFTV